MYDLDLLKAGGAGGGGTDAASGGSGGSGDGVAGTGVGSGGGPPMPASGGTGGSAATTTGAGEAGTGSPTEAGGSAGAGTSGPVMTEPPGEAGVVEADAGLDVSRQDAVVADVGRDAGHPVCDWGECKLVFVTSSAVTADGGSAVRFDVFCQTLARARGLSGQWRAWVSDAVDTVSARMARATVRYRLLDGSTVANDWNDLTSGMLRHAIDISEDGAVSPPVEVWTGTSTAGDRASSLACTDWTTTYGTAIVGQSNMVNYAWTFARQQYCSAAGVHLYCFEQ